SSDDGQTDGLHVLVRATRPDGQPCAWRNREPTLRGARGPKGVETASSADVHAKTAVDREALAEIHSAISPYASVGQPIPTRRTIRGEIAPVDALAWTGERRALCDEVVPTGRHIARCATDRSACAKRDIVDAGRHGNDG